MLRFAARHFIDQAAKPAHRCHLAIAPALANYPTAALCRHASALAAPFYFQILRLPPAGHAHSCLSHVDSYAIDRILHVYLPALSYDILRHMSGYVRLLLLTYLLSPRTHAFLIVITSFLRLDLRRYCFLFSSSRPDALELLFAFVIRTPPSCSRNAWRCSVSYLLLQHQIPLPPAPSRAAAKADVCLVCIFLIRAANSN